MGKTPKRLQGPAQLANAAATIYTTPAATRTIVRHIHIHNPPGGGARTFTMSIGADAAGTRIFDAFQLADGQVLDHFCYYVLEATQIIQAFASAATAVVCTIDGDEHTL